MGWPSGMGQRMRVRGPRQRLAGDRREPEARCLKGHRRCFCLCCVSVESFPSSLPPPTLLFTKVTESEVVPWNSQGRFKY